MFTRDGQPILTFRVYDGFGYCIDEFTGTMAEWQRQITAKLPTTVYQLEQKPRSPLN